MALKKIEYPLAGTAATGVSTTSVEGGAVGDRGVSNHPQLRGEETGDDHFSLLLVWKSGTTASVEER